MIKHIPYLAKMQDCTGCMACVDSCNTKALQSHLAEDGHLYPKFDSSICVMCLQCEKSCPIVNGFSYQSDKKANCYAAWNNNVELRKGSSSGGAFSAMAVAVLDRGGVVIGAAMKGVCEVYHKAIFTKDELFELQGSKYTQSNTEGIYKETFSLLKKGYLVLFSGMGCQIGGLLSFLDNKKYEGRLITVDLICGGVPSKHLIYKFIENEPYEIKYILSFRTKDKGWSPNGFKYNLKTEDSRGCIHDYTNKSDLITNGFSRELTNRWSCYNCSFIGIKRLSDFTIGDFWGINEFKEQFYDGISLIITHSDKAESFLKDISDYITCKLVNEIDAARHNYRLYCGKLNKSHSLERKLLKWFSKHLSYKNFKRIYAYDNPGFLYRVYSHMSQLILDIFYSNSKNKNK